MSRLARLGAFIVATLAVLAVGVFIIGSREYLFRSTYQLKAQFDNVAGLSDGADVEVGGVHSGTVQSIELPHQAGGKVMVLMNMDKVTREIIKHDSIASIETEGVLGNQFVAISFGTGGQANVRDGELLQSVPPLQVADLLKKASVVLDSSQAALANVTLATGHLNSVSAKIDSGKGTVGALVNDKALYSNLQASTATMQTTMVQAQLGVTGFRENMDALKHNFILSGFFKKRGYEDSSQIGANKIDSLPAGTPIKTFSFTAKDLFDKRDSARLKDEKALKAGGDFLAANPFGVAVIVVSSGMLGDTQKDLTLSEARAMVVRTYLVQNFGFDDTQLRTMGMGKQDATAADADWGSVQILIFPVGTEIPEDKPALVTSAPVADVKQPLAISVAQPR